MLVALSPLGVGGHRPGDQTAVGDRRGRAHLSDGAALRPPRYAGVGARLRPAISDRWVPGVSDGLTDPLWALGAAVSASGQRSHAQAALDAAAAVALRASGQDHAAPASGAAQSAR